jgi:Rod binding domain-containing protein
MANDTFGKIGGASSSLELSALRAKNLESSLKEAGIKGPGKEARIKQAATDFEGMLLQQMFKSMWASVPESGLTGGGGKEGEYFRDMFIEGLSKDVAKGQGLGIKEIIQKELERQK